MNDFEGFFYDCCSEYANELIGPNAYGGDWDRTHERMLTSHWPSKTLWPRGCANDSRTHHRHW